MEEISTLPQTAPQEARKFDLNHPRLLSAFLCLLIFLGIACRFYGLYWDDGTLLHPDERFCTSIVPRLSFPTSVSQFLDSRVSPLNPANLKDVHYVYGQLPLFIGFVAAKVAHLFDGTFVAPWLHLKDGEGFLVVGRLLSALFDCGTIFWTLLIARRLLDSRWSLLTAALVAGAALHIQQSHFFVVDPFAACFLTASFWAGVRLVQDKKWPDAALCGLFFGAALACKISAALFGVALLGFLFLFARQNPIKKTLLCGLLCFFAALVAFRLGHPMAFRGEFGFFDLRPESRFWGDVNFQGAITRGEIDVPFDVQWIGRTPLLYSLRNLGYWGYGWPLLLSAAAGAAVLLRKSRGHDLLWVGTVFGLVLLIVQGAAFSKFTRYFLPLTPFCALLATYFWREISAQKPVLRWGPPLVALSATLWGMSVASIYGRPHTRLAASQWIVDNIEPGTYVANETAWDEGLPISWGKSGSGDLKTVVLDSYEVDSPMKRAALGQKLDQAEWIFLSSGRSWQNIPRWPEKWPLMTEFYRALFDGRLGFRAEKSFTSFPQFGPLQFPDAGVEEALTVYDHPLVMLFHKTSDYDSEKVRALFDAVQLPENQGWMPKLAPKPNEKSLPLPSGF